MFSFAQAVQLTYHNNVMSQQWWPYSNISLDVMGTLKQIQWIFVEHRTGVNITCPRYSELVSLLLDEESALFPYNRWKLFTVNANKEWLFWILAADKSFTNCSQKLMAAAVNNSMSCSCNTWSAYIWPCSWSRRGFPWNGEGKVPQGDTDFQMLFFFFHFPFSRCVPIPAFHDFL